MGQEKFTKLAEALKQSEVLDYDQAWSMPRSYYVDEDVAALERERLFGREWLCFGRAEEVARAGDFMAFQLCDEPLVAVRGEDGKLRVFSNVCRHRGAILAEGRGNRPRLVCPYHQWSYDFEGKLAGAPRMEPHKSFDRASCRLPEFPVEEWHGFFSPISAATPNR